MSETPELEDANGHELHMWSPLSITDEWLIW